MLSRSCSALRLKTTLSPSPATIITGSVRFRLAIAVYIHKRTAAGSIVTECDRDPTVAHIVRVKPASVRDAVGLPAAVACNVKPVKPLAPSLFDHAILKSCGVRPQTVASSPGWKLRTVLQMSAEAE